MSFFSMLGSDLPLKSDVKKWKNCSCNEVGMNERKKKKKRLPTVTAGGTRPLVRLQPIEDVFLFIFIIIVSFYLDMHRQS